MDLGLHRFFGADGNLDDGYYVLVTFLMDSAGSPAGVIWSVTYEANFDPNNAYVGTPQVVNSPSKNADGTYKLVPKNYGETYSDGYGLNIASFSLMDHTGTAVVGGSTVSYTATEVK